ncbi:MAG: phosphoribosylformylglycinamidine cyclo-ligase [Alphaproteobacteria bacterium]|nr:phosphoribosylformylglycinamidine cyclo-ligase [Alphaproteobacteria bacterium]
MTTQSAPKDAYAKAGVNIDAGNELVRRIKPLAKSTARRGADAGLGGFGAFFDIKATGYKDPLIVSSNDGVGTKLKIALETGLHDGIGIDCVAMCVNDLVVSRAEPLFFLDYYACGKLDVNIAERVIASVAEGCRQAGAALVGGETAELPGLYAENDYDLAGFSVGAVERDEVITGKDVKAGDVVIGLLSNGVHSNGYSLVRKIVKDGGFDYKKPAPFEAAVSLAEALLRPTRIYVKPLLELCKVVPVHGMAHITGGGLLENIPRVLPDGLGVTIDCAAWKLPAVFKWLAAEGKISATDMVRTFNCGIGMVVMVAAADAAKAQAQLTAAGVENLIIGKVEPRATQEEQMRFEQLEALCAN